ncbi:glycosyl hydrolase family 61 domain-containing protein [Rhizoctonia solani AG-1 IA]|uniref:AA9 family lytic polysaccharide monooxygenase n=1 Tax=Thanatephorus cucumeris (strain AG1-IA) TaxID=983506 RepID=L8X1J5_THACA|nr:glycosyl hydrolase family 61 domain-containing protein [Rhizoctonia solani AG-1 IA]
MRLSYVFTRLAAAAASVSAHSTVWGVWINGVDQGDGQNQYIRSPPEIRSRSNVSQDNNFVILYGQHSLEQGSTTIATMRSLPHHIKDREWVKLYQEGYNGNWAVDKIIATHGQHSIKIPNIASGQYLLRPELISAFELGYILSTTLPVGPNYILTGSSSCIQIEVQGSGSTLPSGVAFPGTYKYSDPGLVFNLYESSPSSYVIPGPAVWSGSAGGSISRAGTPGQAPPSGGSGGSGTVDKYQQCGGIGWSGIIRELLHAFLGRLVPKSMITTTSASDAPDNSPTLGHIQSCSISLVSSQFIHTQLTAMSHQEWKAEIERTDDAVLIFSRILSHPNKDWLLNSDRIKFDSLVRPHPTDAHAHLARHFIPEEHRTVRRSFQVQTYRPMSSDIPRSRIIDGIIDDDALDELFSQLIQNDTGGYPENTSYVTDPTIYSHATDMLHWDNVAQRSVSKTYRFMYTQVGDRSLDIIAEGGSTGSHKTSVNHNYQYFIQPHPPEPETVGHIQGISATTFAPSLNYSTTGVTTLATCSIQGGTPIISQDIPGPPISTADNFDNTNTIIPASRNPPNWMYVPLALYPSEEAITHFVHSYKGEMDRRIREVSCSLCVWEGRSKLHDSSVTFSGTSRLKQFTTMDQAVVHSMNHHSATRQNAEGTFERLSSVGDN